MRIIAGSLGGRRIKAPRGHETRPTTDRVREALFSILRHPPEGTEVLDLCAGAGTLGLEALSRGATRAVFVERAAAALRCLRGNLETLGLEQASEVHKGDALSVLRRLKPSAAGFYWVFMDPPYQSRLAREMLGIIASRDLLAEGGSVIVEHDRRNQPEPSHGSLVRTDQRRYGDTVVSFYKYAS